MADHPTISDTSTVMRVIATTAHVSPRAYIGNTGEWRDRPTTCPAIICNHAIIREAVRVHAGCERPTTIGAHTLLMAGCHIGHDTQIGERCEVAPNAVVGGCCTIGNRVKIGMGAIINPRITIGADAVIGSGAVVLEDVPAGQTWVGVPARRIGGPDT